MLGRRRGRRGEEQDRAAVAFVVPVAEAGGAVGSGDRLALPVDERAADGVVAVAGGGGEAAAGLVEREGEQLGVGRLRLVDTALPGGDLRLVPAEAHGGEDLDAAVAGVDLQRHVGVGHERLMQVVDPAVQDAEQLSRARLATCG